MNSTVTWPCWHAYFSFWTLLIFLPNLFFKTNSIPLSISSSCINISFIYYTDCSPSVSIVSAKLWLLPPSIRPAGPTKVNVTSLPSRGWDRSWSTSTPMRDSCYDRILTFPSVSSVFISDFSLDIIVLFIMARRFSLVLFFIFEIF